MTTTDEHPVNDDPTHQHHVTSTQRTHKKVLSRDSFVNDVATQDTPEMEGFEPSAPVRGLHLSRACGVCR